MSLSFPKKKPRKPKQKAEDRGRWVYVPENELTPEQIEDNLEADKDEVMSKISVFGDPNYPFARIDEFHDYFPGNNEVPKGGSWIMVTKDPGTRYIPPPLSIWFATAWPMFSGRHQIHRVKILTPKGELGLFPHEYSRVENPEKYYEFIGDGMTVKFFGGAGTKGVPADALFYLRSRGVSLKDAMIMLIGSIKAHGVLWLETDENVIKTFGYEWPAEHRLATNGEVDLQTDEGRPEPTATGSGPAGGAGDGVESGEGEGHHGAHVQTEWGLGERTDAVGGDTGKTEVFKPFGGNK